MAPPRVATDLTFPIAFFTHMYKRGHKRSYLGSLTIVMEILIEKNNGVYVVFFIASSQVLFRFQCVYLFTHKHVRIHSYSYVCAVKPLFFGVREQT